MAVRWVAELLSKHAAESDGRTPYQRIRSEDCVVPWVPFGERVLYLPLKIVRQDKGEVAKKPGIWLGVNERTEEILIGTKRGII